VFWTTKDRSIVAAFGIEDDSEDPGKIYEFDLSTETVGAPFEHAGAISGLAFSFSCALLASASGNKTTKLWAFESHQLLASFDVTIAL
jgi:WD40 repeat protein